MASNGSAYHSLWTDFSFRVAHRWEQPSLMKGHTLRPAQGSYCLSNDGTFLRWLDQAPPRNQCLRLHREFPLALLSRLSGFGKVLSVWAEARKVTRVRPQSIVSI